ncbi:plasmid mobilization relaxosome protein MobC [Tsukamurella pulmonis]|nr:plasmid mobilization relaxosome protein MobC [Tsukamurella pulmonis]
MRVSATEAAALDRVAARLRLTRSAALRRLVDLADADEDGRRSAAVAPSAELVALRMEVHRIGVNVNQAVRALHAGGHDAAADAAADLLDALADAVEAVEKAAL